MTGRAPTVVSCPTCGKPVEWTSANAWRPFCSERCRLIDLGAWIEEEHRIPGDSTPEHPDQEG
ncbi:MAG: DNA gyrase inhibitor YacG [Gammaproteobacteria bacterium]